MKFVFSLILFFSLVFCQAQISFDEKLDSLKRIKNHQLTIQFLEDFKKEYQENDTIQLGKLYHELALAYYGKKNYSKSLENIEKAITMKESIRIVDAYSFQKSLNLLASVSRKIGDLERRIEAYNQILAEKEETKFAQYALRGLALYQMDIGDYFKSIEYSDRALNSYHRLEKPNKRYYLRSLIDVIDAYALMSSNDLETLKKVNAHKQIVEETIESFSGSQKIKYYSNLGVIYRGYDKKELALSSYQKALENVNSVKTSESEVNSIYNNIGEMYSQLKESKKANEYYQKVLSTNDSINISAVYNNIGYYHAESVDEEIKLHQKAIGILERESGLTENSFFPEEIKNSLYKEEFLSAFIDLSQAWIKRYEESKDLNNLEEALKVLYRIDNFISVIRLDSRTKASKLFWIDRGVNSYLEAAKVCFLLSKPSEAFYFMEKNKSLYLLEELGKLQLRNEYKIPSELIEKEANLSYKILLAKNNALQSRYNKAYQDHAQFVDSLNREFPEYYNSHLNPKLIPLSDFQDFLAKKNAQAVEYILGENEGYGLWMNGETVDFFQLNDYSKLVDNISFLKQAFRNPAMSKEDVSKYRKVGLETFRILFPWKDALEEIELKKLKIIPSGVLYNFQFESLLVGEEPILKDNFLINFAEVSYLNSASVSQNLYNTESVNSHSYLGVAPVNFKSQELVSLKGSEKVTSEIASLFSSELKLKEKATKSEFLTSSKNALIFHINTHAGIDEKTKLPWLSMQDSLVSLDEMYIKSQPHNLVFLDACKTSDGKLQRGEGVESLSRAFFHSGSKSVIASQWNANEKATNEISLLFFQELKKGSSKSAALRQAKLTYLENNQLSNTFPYFWASLSLTGNSDALPEVSNTYYYLMIIGIILLIVLFFSIRRKRSV